jgi:hypothetical protein
VRAPKDGGGTVWKLRARLRFEFKGEAKTATATSRLAFSEIDAAKLQSWVAQHREGSHVDIRVDPSRASRVEFAAAEMSSTAGRIRTDLILLAVAAIACGVMLALAKYLRAREASAVPVADDGQRGQPAFGLLFAVPGLLVTGTAIYHAIDADPFVADNLMGVPAGLMFVFAGVLLGLPPQYSQWRNLLTALVITCFALTFDWVAFGPGERKFSGSFMGFGFIPGELLGRALFGVFAVILDGCAIAMWVGLGRRALGLSARSPFSGQQSPVGKGETSPTTSTA